jgi:ketosteroid isomerase-like protein
VLPAGAPADIAATVREHFDHIERGNIAQAIADYAEEALLEADPRGEQGLLLTGTFRGREATGRWIDNWFSSFEPGSYRFEIEESIEHGDRVFMTVFHTARGAGSGADVALRVYHAFRVRGGLILRHVFSSADREAILHAAGIDPDAIA